MRFSKRELEKEIRKEQKTKARALLEALQAEAREAKAARRAAKAGVKIACSRATAREIREAYEAEKAAAKTVCASEKARALGLVGVVAKRTEAARAELRYQRELRRIEASVRARRASHRTASASERRGESDDEVRQNLPPSLVPAFERVKGIIKAGPRRSRTEAFLEYAEAHPDVRAAADANAEDALIAEMQARQNEPERAASRGFGGVDAMAIAALAGAALLLYVIFRGPSKAAPSSGLPILARAA